MAEIKSYYDYSVKKSPDFRTRLLQVLLIAGYSIFIALYTLFFCVLGGKWVMLILLVFIVYALFSLTWRFTQAEIEYSYECGTLNIAKIYSGKTRRMKKQIELSELVSVKPYKATEAIDGIIDYTGNIKSGNAYILEYTQKGQKNGAVIIEADEELLRLIKFSKPSAFTNRNL